MANPKDKAGGNVPAKTAPEVPAYVEPTEYNPALETWDEATAGAHEVIGHDLAKDELLDALVGVPFLITRFTFREGVPATEDTPLMRKGDKYAYVSAEIVIAPEVELKRRRVNVDTLPFDPGSQVVFNDGSTGIYRQVVNYLNTIGAIELPEGPDEGSKGNVRYDLPPWKWTAFNSGIYVHDTVNDTGTYEVNVRLRCPRGIRRSDYTTDFGEAGTRYLG